jgi:hypothetical protein
MKDARQCTISPLDVLWLLVKPELGAPVLKGNTETPDYFV